MECVSIEIQSSALFVDINRPSTADAFSTHDAIFLALGIWVNDDYELIFSSMQSSVIVT